MSQQEDRPYMVLYKDKWKALTDTLSKQERSAVISAFFDYLTFGKEPLGLSKIARGFYEFLKTSEEKGKKRGAPIGNSNRRNNPENNSRNKSKGIETSNQNSNQDELKNQIENQCSTEAEAEAEAYAKAEREPPTPGGGKEGAPPTLEEVRMFCRKERLKMKPDTFWHYYNVRHWIVQGEPCQDWHGLARYWASREKEDIEPESEPKIPVQDLEKCPLCGCTKVKNMGPYGICDGCGKGLAWNYREGRWQEERHP